MKDELKQTDDLLGLKAALDRIKQYINPSLSELQEKQVLTYFVHLLEVNRYMNLTAITDYDQMMELHLLDSISVLPYLPIEENLQIIDIGTGAGLPGLPLKIFRPDFDLTLLDATKKRLSFLDECLHLTGLEEKAKTLHGRAEEISRQKKYRESYDIAIARAVASLNVLVELCLPLVKLNGFFIAMKGNSTQEIKEAEKAIELLGGDIADVIDFQLPISKASRSLILIQKIEETKPKYPRHAAKIKNMSL